MDIRHMLLTPRFSASFMQEKVTIEEKDHTYIRCVVDNYTLSVISEWEIEYYSIKRLRIKNLVMNRSNKDKIEIKRARIFRLGRSWLFNV